jgi:hypothetical protein
VRSRRLLFLLLLITCVIWAARVSERYSVAVDLSATGLHSLSDSAQQALDQLGSGLQITAFMPDLLVQRAELEQLLAPYLAHRSAPELAYVDPLKNPDQAEALGAHASGELHLRWGERTEVLSQVTREQLDLALNRLALRGERWIVSLTGHGEHEIDQGPAGLADFADRAQQLGYQMIALDPRRIDRLPDNTAMLLIAAPSQAYDERVADLVRTYLTAGGRVFWLGRGTDPSPASALTIADFGLRQLDGVIVDADAARFGLDSPANAIATLDASDVLPRGIQQPAALYRARAFDVALSNEWSEVARFSSGTQSWNETSDLTGRLRRDPVEGELAGPLPIAIALQAATLQDPGRLVYVGSPYLLSNAHIGRLGNRQWAFGLLRWLTENTALRSESRPTHQLRWSPLLGSGLAILTMVLLPLGYLVAGVWLRTQRRRG